MGVYFASDERFDYLGIGGIAFPGQEGGFTLDEGT